MKKILLLVVAAVLGFASCTKDLENRVSKLEDSVESIQKQITELTEKLNSEVSALQKLIDALENNVYVTGVSNIMEGDKVIGYTITLSKGPAITIYHGTDGKNGSNGINGNNGKTPEIGVVVEDGVYYWTVNGKILTDADGNKIPVYAKSDAPQFKYEDGKWWISTDGQNWSALVSAAGNAGDSIFSDVRYDGTTVTIVLQDGTEIVLPREGAFRLDVEKTQVAVLAGSTFKVGYTVAGATETTTVYAVADGGWSVKVEGQAAQGNLVITAPSPLTDGKVIVFAGDNTKAAMATISFVEGVVNVAENEYTVSKEGGNIEVPVSTNYTYEVSIPENASWLTYVETKAMRNETIVLNAAANSSTSRKATVTIKSGSKVWCTFDVVQEGSVAANVTVEDLIGNWTVSYISGANVNLSYTMPIEASDDASKGNLVLKRWFNESKKYQDETIYATFDAGSMTLSIADGQKIKGSYNDPGRAKDKDGNWLDPIVFTVSGDGKTLSIDSKVQFGTYYLSQFTSFGSNYSLTKEE